MHDTIQNFDACVDGVCTTNFNPKRALESVEPLSNKEFISDYKRMLSELNVRVQSDYAELKKNYHSQSRRLDALEGLVPSIHMQQQKIADVSCELRALKRVVTELQVIIEEQRRPLLDRLFGKVMHVLQLRV